MTESIVTLIHETLIPELVSMEKVITGIVEVVKEFTTFAEKHPGLSFSKLCELIPPNSGDEQIAELERVSKALIDNVPDAYLEIAAESIGYVKDVLLDKYPVRLAILVGVFRIRFYDNLVVIASNPHDADDLTALTELAKNITNRFSKPITDSLEVMVDFFNRLASNNELPSEDYRHVYSKWATYSNTVGESVYKQIANFYPALTSWAQKQISLSEIEGFDVNQFNREIEEAEIKFAEDANRELALDEFGLVDEENESLKGLDDGS